MASNKERFEDSKSTLYTATTPIVDLFITGQDVVTSGVAGTDSLITYLTLKGALTGGILTAHAVLEYDAVDVAIFGRNIITDLMNVSLKKKTN